MKAILTQSDVHQSVFDIQTGLRYMLFYSEWQKHASRCVGMYIADPDTFSTENEYTNGLEYSEDEALSFWYGLALCVENDNIRENMVRFADKCMAAMKEWNEAKEKADSAQVIRREYDTEIPF